MARSTRWLVSRFPAAVGVDVASAAVTWARDESDGTTNVSFRVMDAAAVCAGAQLRAELGEANVFVRGLSTPLTPLAGELRPVLGSRGRVTAYRVRLPGRSVGLPGTSRSHGADDADPLGAGDYRRISLPLFSPFPKWITGTWCSFAQR